MFTKPKTQRLHTRYHSTVNGDQRVEIYHSFCFDLYWSNAEMVEKKPLVLLEFLRTTDVGRKAPVEKAETESSESGTEQECPRGECVCGLCGW